MFRSATLKLTGVYVGILFVICLIFSTALYQVLSNELVHNYNRQTSFFQERPRFQPYTADPEAVRFLDEQLEQGKRRILVELFYIDLAILVAGGFASYLLARRTLRPIEQAHHAQTRFTADASHELRTPLATMQTEIEVALRDPKLKLSESKELLKSNLEELATLRQLTDGLLTLARSDDSTQRFSRVSLDSVSSDALARVERQLKKKSITVAQEITKGLAVHGDKAQLTEALVILLDNAVKYSPAKTDITLRVSAQQNTVIIAVIDQGIGITKDEADKAFERFYRSDIARTKSKQNGHGLGLSIAKQIIEQHGGTIRLAGNDPVGTTATITLPGVAQQ